MTWFNDTKLLCLSLPSLEKKSQEIHNTHIFHEHSSKSIELKLKNKQEKKDCVNKRNGICNNRECKNPSGFPSKPNSLYCSSRCQSRGLYPV